MSNHSADEATPSVSRAGSASGRQLGPVRTGHESPPIDIRPPSRTSLNDIEKDVAALESKKKDPLPPITAETKDYEDFDVTDSTSEMINNTMAGSVSSSSMQSTRRPRILNGYKREMDDENVDDDDDDESTFSDDSGRQGKEEPPMVMNREVHYTTNHDGSEQVLVSIECQTEWSYLDDMQKLGKNPRGASQASNKSRNTPHAPPVNRQSSYMLHPAQMLGRKGFFVQEDPMDDDFVDTDLNIRESISAADRKTLLASRNADSKLSYSGSEAPLPVPSREDEYGIPILHLSSDSEDSDDDSIVAYQNQQKAQENEYEDAQEAGTLPSIGPPQILQYQRESKKFGVNVTDPDMRLISEQEFEDYKQSYGDIQSGMFEGECEFCHKPIKPFPSVEDQRNKDPSELYCCTEYSEFVHFMISHPLHQQHQADKKIDIKPHPPYGSKQARRMAKERAAQRMRERELARQQAAIQAGRGGDGGGGNFYQSMPASNITKAGNADFMNLARQMKTINYQLSSQKCLEEGWTIRPPSPLLDDGPGEVFEPEPILPSWAEEDAKPAWGEFDDPNATVFSTRRGPAHAQPEIKRKRQLILKYYEDGSKFIILFPDGTGTVFYPSGRPAITISSLEQGLFTYVVTDDTDVDERNQGSVLAVFEPNGYGVSYFNNGQVRVYLDQIGGMELDAKGSRKRKWSWKEQVQHIHAPPLQPITFAVAPNFGVRIMAQDNITLTYTNKSRSCRFQVGAKLRLVAPENMQPSDIDEEELFRNEVRMRIESLFNKVSNLLKFPKSPKLNQLPNPQHLTSRVNKLSKIKEEKMERAKRKGPPQGVVTVN